MTFVELPEFLGLRHAIDFKQWQKWDVTTFADLLMQGQPVPFDYLRSKVPGIAQ